MTATTIAPVPTSPGIATGVFGRLHNPVFARRREWVFIAVPYGVLTNDRLSFVTDRGLRLRAIKCESVGEHSTIYRVFAPFGEGQTLQGEFYIPGDVPNDDQFKLHPWVEDAPVNLVPNFRIEMNGQFYDTTMEAMQLGEEFRNDCMWRIRFRAPLGASGFIVEGFLSFYDNSPVADIRAAITWSDRNSPAQDRQVSNIFLLVGSPVVFDFALRYGGTQLPVPDATGKWITRICPGVGFVDGSSIPVMGRMLCLPDGPVQLSHDAYTYSDDDENANLTQDWETLIAAAQGPVYGAAYKGAWKGRMLAHRNTPRLALPQEHLEARVDALLAPFFASLNSTGSYYEDRQIGCSRNPGQTGDQQDFGSTKGWEATEAGDPRWLHYAYHAVLADFFRGVLHYENGKPLDPSAHPQWVTWTGYTHYSTSVSPDRLGKSSGAFGSRTATNWTAYDEEHRSQNNLAVLYALTGDPLLGMLIEHYSTTDIANVRYRLNYGTGAVRAIGRTAQCWANFMTLFHPATETHRRFRALVDDLARQTMRDWLGDKSPGPVDVVYDRTDPRMGITFNGVALPAWSCWEHGLFTVGVYAAWKVTKDARWWNLLRRVCRTIVRYAVFQDVDGWKFVATCHWPKAGGPTGVVEGEPMPLSCYTDRSQFLVTPVNGDVSSWTQNAILIFIETSEPDDPDLPRAMSIAQRFMPSDGTDPRRAEWEACVASTPPIPGAYRNY